MDGVGGMGLRIVILSRLVEDDNGDLGIVKSLKKIFMEYEE